MNLKDRMIIEEYRRQRPDFMLLGETASKMLKDMAKGAGIDILAIEHRVKEERSLAGKLERKGDKYSTLDDLTDILGARAICFFADDVDRLGKLIEESFIIDWENSSDKRELIQVDSFGYLSLHYICSLPSGAGWPEEICNKKFEVQVRTVLQHAWASISHDRGYKSEFGVPRMAVRSFARIAGLLEIADDEFVRVRDAVEQYTEDIRTRITENCADDVLIDMVSLQEYMRRNKPMRAFLQELSEICDAEISEINPENYIVQLRWLGKTKLGDLQIMLSENRALALDMARRSLENSDLDILSSSVALRFLCRAELINKGYTREQAIEFFRLSTGSDARALRQASLLFPQD